MVSFQQQGRLASLEVRSSTHSLKQIMMSWGWPIHGHSRSWDNSTLWIALRLRVYSRTSNQTVSDRIWSQHGLAHAKTCLKGWFIARRRGDLTLQRRYIDSKSLEFRPEHMSVITGSRRNSQSLQLILLCSSQQLRSLLTQLNADLPERLAQLSKALKYTLVYISTGKLVRSLDS